MLANRRSLLLLVVQQIHLVKQAEIVDVIVDTQHLLMIDVRAHQRQVDVGARTVVALRASRRESPCGLWDAAGIPSAGHPSSSRSIRIHSMRS